MMMIHVKLFASLRNLKPGLGLGEAIRVELPERSTVRELVHHLGVPDEEVKLIFVNGIARDLDQALADGDELGLFPPVGGG